MVNVARETDWTRAASRYKDADGNIRKSLEDERSWDLMMANPVLLKGKTWATLPNLEVARAFAVGDVFADELLGYDGALTKRSGRRAEILEWCPKIWILSNAEKED
jgi:hypothetical protein